MRLDALASLGGLFVICKTFKIVSLLTEHEFTVTEVTLFIL